MQPSNGDYVGQKGQLAARLEDLAQVHERITEPVACIVDHLWALRGRADRTQLERFYLIADEPIADIGQALGISRQAIRKQQLLLEAERSENGFSPQGDEKSLSRIVDYQWALTGTRVFTQLLRFYILSTPFTAQIRRGLGVSKQAISRQRKLLRDYRLNALKPVSKKKQPLPPCDPPV
jgi:hypothetical protein